MVVVVYQQLTPQELMALDMIAKGFHDMRSHETDKRLSDEGLIVIRGDRAEITKAGRSVLSTVNC